MSGKVPLNNELWLGLCSELWSAFQLSEAAVGGRVPHRLAQQTVCGVLGQFGVSGNICELGAQGEAVAVQTAGARGVGERREERGALRAERAVKGDQAGGTPGRALRTRVPAVSGFLPLQRGEKREVCQRRQRGEASQSVCSQRGEGSARQRRDGGGQG